MIVSDEVRNYIAQTCLSAGCEGLRADITLYKASLANAALEGREQATIDDVNQVKELVLRHRRKSHEDKPAPKRRPPESLENTPAEALPNQADPHQQVEVEPIHTDLKEKKS